VHALLDPGSFVELDRSAAGRAPGAGRENGAVPADGVVVGTGTVDGRDVAIFALDPAVLGGSLGAVTAAKIVKVQELALRSRMPIIGLHESSGARIQDGMAALAGYAEVFSRSVRCSGVIPQLSVLCGPCTGEARYAPALTDLVFAAAGALGPAEPGPDVHFLAEDEAGCWRAVRRMLSHLPGHAGEAPPFVPTTDPAERADVELQAVALQGREPYDARDQVARLLDDRQLVEVQPHFAPNVVTGMARLGGHSVGILANQPAVLAGAIDADAALKAARFVRFCDAFNVPLVTVVDSPGLLPGGVRDAAKLLYAYAEATVPKVTLVTARDHGSAYFAMSPRQMGADLVLAWPAAEIGATEPEAASAGPYAAAERGYVDLVVEPRETRPALIRGLELCLRKTVDRPARKHGNIPL